ncbi:hypothetical protein [Myroides sp. LJL116]
MKECSLFLIGYYGLTWASDFGSKRANSDIICIAQIVHFTSE